MRLLGVFAVVCALCCAGLKLPLAVSGAVRAVRVSGFNWALFTWQGTRRHTMRCALAVRRGSTAEAVRVCAVL